MKIQNSMLDRMTSENVGNSKISSDRRDGRKCPNEPTGSKNEHSELDASVTMDDKPDIMDQNLNVAELALAISTNTVQPTSEERDQTSGRKVAQTPLQLKSLLQQNTCGQVEA